MQTRTLLLLAPLLLIDQAQAQYPANPLILDQYTADPSAHVFHDTLWVYPSHDRSDAVSFSMEDYHAFSTTDMIHWQDHGVIFSPLTSTSWAKEAAWAPDCVERDGKYYLYYPTDKRHIGVAVSDRPDGPFVDPLGHPLISIDSPGVVCDRDFIDPCCFIDDDGQAYLYMGQNTPCCIKLNPDMISYDGEVHLLEGVHEFFEAAWMHKHDGKYYFSYSDGPFFGHEPRISYCVSDSPLGPFRDHGVVLGPVNSGTNHHSIVEYRGQWWLFYHNADLSLYNDPTKDGHPGVRRSICCDPLYYNEDGSISLVNTTHDVERIKRNTAALAPKASTSATSLPYLEHLNSNTARLVTGGKPMLMIGGELGNSSASTREDLQRIFPHLRALGLNTVLAPVTWELIEPEEGSYDFTSLDDIIREARLNGLKVVVLWFGAWKNSMSCYAPEWMKRDTRRFPRVHDRHGVPMEEFSSLSTYVLEADKRAIGQIMRHIREVDAEEQTVVMVQVENEIGMIEEPRDYSEDATRTYYDSVPEALTEYLISHRHELNNPRLRIDRRNGTWPELFGDDMYGEEIFQAWTYAQYVEQVAQAGKAEYDLPMYVNVALNSRNRLPGQYPSAGPLAHLIDIWHCGAPSLSVLGLDLYDKGYRDWTDRYHLPRNPLFIPEIRLEDQDAMRALYAFGHHDAMGFCPFSIEDYPLVSHTTGLDRSDLDLTQDDQLNAFTANVSALSPIAATYRLLRQVEPLILRCQGTDDMDAVLLDNEMREADILTPDGITLHVRHSYSLGWEPGAKQEVWPEVACIIIRQGKEDYVVIGSGVVITYSQANGNQVGLAKCEQVEFDADGTMRVLRHLNGDQTHQGRHIRIPVGEYQIQRFRLYEY